MPLLRGKFKFSVNDLDSQKELFGNDKICVVSIFGKSDYRSRNCKASLIDSLLQRNVFQTPIRSATHHHSPEELAEEIEGFYDEENQIIYLHLIGVFDSCDFINTCKTLSSQIESKGFLSSWADMKYTQAKALLFLFSITHIMLIVHPTTTFDVGYVHLFRTIDGIRQKIQSRLTEALKEHADITDEWAEAGRPCSPRALFAFQMTHQELDDGSSSTRSAKKLPPIKKLEHALEDQIYKILRKSRVITNISMNSLFAIPANQEFVYVQTSESVPSDPIAFLLGKLREQCLTSLDRSSTPEDSKQDAAKMASTKSVNSDHVTLAKNKGFDDNVGRHAGTSVFELPSGKLWYKVACLLYRLLFDENGEVQNDGVADVLTSLKTHIDVDGRFSETRCLKVLPLASAAYQEGLPSHYSSEIHHSQLAQASRMFALHARGPAFERFASQLQDECDKFWKNGHQLCEVLSLTGNPCLKPIHKMPGEVEEETTEGGRVISGTAHCSQVKFTAACNCGRKLGNRDDPFGAKAANYDFYKQLEKVCCKDLERYDFPIFQPSTSDFKAAKITVSEWASSTQSSNKRDSQNLLKEDRDFLAAPSMSLALSLGQSLGVASGEISGSRLSPQPDLSPRDVGRCEDILSVTDLIETSINSSISEEEGEKVLIRQASTTEYLPGMMHSDSPHGLLPAFQSWSLVCLGPSSLYSHNVGIQDQSGFISSTNFLLPWDVVVKSVNKDKWPTISETCGGRKGHSVKGKKGVREFTVKIFIGTEYECPRGHRFMCSAPDKILKATGSGLVKENASKVATNDMPLYFPCPCSRPGKSVIAQLMRLHVVTPKAPVHVTLDPKVMPSSPPCPLFHPGNPEPIKLSQSTYWVLRLPFIYEGNERIYQPSKDKKATNLGKLLKGTYNVVQVTPDPK
ncbi:hypothetical protein CHUAL_007928 [Chamberlinius hualienensis]